MKVRVTIPGAMASMELEDTKALEVFCELAGKLFMNQTVTLQKSMIGSVIQDAEEEQKDDPEPAQEDKEVKFLTKFTDVAPADQGEDVQPLKYKGFLYIECPECGSRRGFCAKTPINEQRCKCGKIIQLNELSLLYLKCECGAAYRYRTNITEFAFDIPCLTCGTPVAVKWNQDKGIYQTIV